MTNITAYNSLGQGSTKAVFLEDTKVHPTDRGSNENKNLYHLLFKVLKCIFLCTLQIWSLNETSIVIKLNPQQ
jgi:hypothetical protein